MNYTFINKLHQILKEMIRDPVSIYSDSMHSEPNYTGYIFHFPSPIVLFYCNPISVFLIFNSAIWSELFI